MKTHKLLFLSIYCLLLNPSRYQQQLEMNMDFKPHHPTFIVDLNEDDFDRRSEFCERYGLKNSRTVLILLVT